MIGALSPLDGRYAKIVESVAALMSEQELMHARLGVEVRYFIALSEEKKIRELPSLTKVQKNALFDIVSGFNAAEARKIKTIEKKTNHDVKAVEYYLKDKVKKIKDLKKHVEFVHFGLTSEDVNNLAYGVMIQRLLKESVLPDLKAVIKTLTSMTKKWDDVSMLSLTHGQPATPTTVGKELRVFVDRLERQHDQLKALKMQGKFGGAVGNYSAHSVAYPDVNWPVLGRKFVKKLGLDPLEHTTQINPHDDIAELSHVMQRIDGILIDLSRDMWSYVSRGIFKQKPVKGEVGSSTMPHKINPIDFENAEGNLGVANALFQHFADKLPVSRMQRDLSDSTVQRNVGVAFGHTSLALASLNRGLKKLSISRSALKYELQRHPEVLAEAIQTLLRKKGVPDAYEKLKEATRGEHVSLSDMVALMDACSFTKEEMRRVLGILR